MTNLAPNVIKYYNKATNNNFQLKTTPNNPNLHNFMSKPQKPFQPQRIQRTINQQSWIIFTLIFIGLGIDVYWQHKHFIITKNLLIGAILAWIGQLVFAKIALSITGIQHKKIVHRMYQASIAKWLITFIGFIIIFISLKPLSPLWLFLGYIILQISHAIITYRIKL